MLNKDRLEKNCRYNHQERGNADSDRKDSKIPGNI